MSATVTDRDHGWRDLVKRAREIARGARVRVGILADEPKRAHPGRKSKTGLSVAEVGAVHEFGAPGAGVPQRSFIRAPIDANKGEIRALQHVVATRVFQGKITALQGLNQIGAKVASMCQRAIAAGIEPPLKPETVRRKRSSKPLVDTGQLKSSITWKAED